ncbi:hypothetical protein LUZ60_004799 [Juncus effusus]|nr:hypothetical protein LUZ60_004799 [Juncus effusus]
MGLFENMVKNYKIAPDGFILLSVLMVCGSKGMVQNGKKIFNSIFNEYKIEPWPEHYSCMVDMLGKANKIQEAEHLMHLMPNGPTLSALQSLLNACRIHGDNETGKRVADLLLETGLSDSGAFVSISNVFAERGEWESVARVRKGMREKGVRKEVGFSWVDLGFLDRDLRVYKFASDDCGHPLVGKIYEIVESLGVEMKILQEDLDVEMDVLV